MKRLLIISVLTVLILSLATTTLFSQLNENATYIKNNYEPQYETNIKFNAKYKWPGDHKMIVHEINKQSDAFFEIVSLLDTNYYGILFDAIDKWPIDNMGGYNDGVWEDPQYNDDDFLTRFLTLQVDWPMVLYEYKNQVEAYNSY